MERFTQIQMGAFEKIQINAGVILKEFLKMALDKNSFQNLWFVGDYTTDNNILSGNFIAIHLKSALSTGGFQWQSTKDGKGQFAFEFTGHYDLNKADDPPFDLYLKWKEDASEAV